MYLAVPVLAHPEGTFGPGEAGVAAATGRRDRGEHTAGVRIDLLDAILGELIQVLAVEGRSRMRNDIDRAQRLAAGGVEGVDLLPSRKPDILTIVRDAIHALGPRKGSVLSNDVGGGSTHDSILVNRQERREAQRR